MVYVFYGVKILYTCTQEYEAGSTPEAVIVKDLDKFDMIFQAFEYEQGKHRWSYYGGVIVPPPPFS